MTNEQRQALIDLQNKEGKLTPTEVIESARAKTSPLHSLFEWDNGRAADSYRIQQARELIRTVRLEVTIHKREVRVVHFTRDPDVPKDEMGYVNITKVNPQNARLILAHELRELIGHVVRCEQIARAKADALPEGTAAALAKIASNLGGMVLGLK